VHQSTHRKGIDAEVCSPVLMMLKFIFSLHRVFNKYLKGASKNSGLVIGETTGETTSHLTKAASCQVIGYSHSTKRDETCAKSLVIRRRPESSGIKYNALLSVHCTVSFINWTLA
jgi:hypothetical protein